MKKSDIAILHLSSPNLQTPQNNVRPEETEEITKKGGMEERGSRKSELQKLQSHHSPTGQQK